jgi:hypothetical protein
MRILNSCCIFEETQFHSAFDLRINKLAGKNPQQFLYRVSKMLRIVEYNLKLPAAFSRKTQFHSAFDLRIMALAGKTRPITPQGLKR